MESIVCLLSSLSYESKEGTPSFKSTMLFTSLLSSALFFLSSFARAEVAVADSGLAVTGRKPTSSVCSKQLAGVVYAPMTPARAYMMKIGTELKFYINAVLNEVSIGQYGLLGKFISKYGVQVTINSFFNTPFTFLNTPIGLAASSTYLNFFTQTDAQLALGLDSFRYDAETGNYFYGFVARSDETAAGAVVTIILPASQAAAFSPVGCK